MKKQNSENLEKAKKMGALVCDARPKMMWLESTSRCNLKCITCPRTYLPFFKGKDLEGRVFDIIKEELFPYLNMIFLNGFGEPMMAANFEYFFDEAVKSDIKVSFNTNGMFLTEKWIRKFLANNICFNVSLDGAREQTFQKIRKGANFRKIITSLELFNKLKENEYKDTEASVSIFFVALRSNIKELTEIINIAKRLNISDVLIQYFNASAIHPLSVQKESLKYDKKLANSQLALAKEKADEAGVNLEISFYNTGEVKKIYNVKSSGSRFPRKCFMPWESISVRANGDVTPCCASGEIMGNIVRDGFWDVWNGAKYRRFRRRINTDFPPLDCRNCVQTFGINAGNPQNTKPFETLGYKIFYFFEHKYRFLKFVYHYLRYYF